MNLRLIIIFLILSLSVESNLFCRATSPNKVNGGYKKCTIYYYNYKFGEIDKKSKMKEIICCYNDKGKIIELIDYYNYFKYKPGLSITEKKNYKYNKNDSLISEIRYSSDGSIISKIIYKYDKMLNLLEEISYSENGSIEQKIIYKYNSGYLIQWQVIDYEGNIKEIMEYKYNDIGNLIEMDFHNPILESSDSKTTYEYNNEGKLFESIFEYADYSTGPSWVY